MKTFHFHLDSEVREFVAWPESEAPIQREAQMRLGYALTEELPCTDGMPVTFKLKIAVLHTRHMPKVEVNVIEEHEPEGPSGAEGVGEIGLAPTARAIAAYDGMGRMRASMKDSPAAPATNLGHFPDEERERWH